MSPLTLIPNSDTPVRQVPLGLELRAGGRRSAEDKRLCYSPSCGCAARNQARAPRRAAA
ncbi:hypothetical protein ACFQ78_22720 [Streptomyces sp. NPDC056519]|uniref:hypothetical protein n=1 Tax=Streptomyces sp. NPDC056519 TaxID=3345849 RepID=UPI0036747F2E